MAVVVDADRHDLCRSHRRQELELRERHQLADALEAAEGPAAHQLGAASGDDRGGGAAVEADAGDAHVASPRATSRIVAPRGDGGSPRGWRAPAVAGEGAVPPCYDAVRLRPGRTRVRGAPTLLEVYNSLSGRKEEFWPLEDRVVRMYVCGITPYDVGHLGHARVFVFFDTVRRYFEFNAYRVRHVQNITDVDDDMVRVSQRLGLTIAELTERNQQLYLQEMDALNVQRPDLFPKASEHIDGMIALVQALLRSGHAYGVDGYVFFDTATTPRFGALAGHDREGLRHVRNDSMPQEPEELKRDALDFLLWQPSEQAGAAFDSPWGRGRPGWHIECSAMVHAALGDRIDIHGGGSDLRYPHHDSEIVQSECATGAAPYVSLWMHIGTELLEGVKMSKSLGNLVKVSELLVRGHTPDGIRLYLLGTPYREQQDFSPAALSQWEQRAATLARAAAAAGGPPDRLRVQPLRNEFTAAMDDGFDTPRAIAALLRIADGVERQRLAGETAVPALLELAGVLGLRLGREG
ncbi:MAG: cysteine--tRNA ligase [Dehalococcoidia bacterium]|nr:cysteine--tRNA ligase [Dehalococcoidia bacterium]